MYVTCSGDGDDSLNRAFVKIQSIQRGVSDRAVAVSSDPSFQLHPENGRSCGVPVNSRLSCPAFAVPQ